MLGLSVMCNYLIINENIVTKCIWYGDTCHKSWIGYYFKINLKDSSL